MEKEELENLFAKASRIDEAQAGYHTPEEWASMRKLAGAKRFKRRVLGLCGRTTVKSLDEMAQLLHQTGIASSVEEGRTITPSLVGGRLYYGWAEIKFTEVINTQGKKAYRVSVYTPSCASF